MISHLFSWNSNSEYAPIPIYVTSYWFSILFLKPGLQFQHFLLFLKRMTMTMVCVKPSKLTWQEILVPGNGSGNKISSFSQVTCPCHDQLKYVTNKFNVVVTEKTNDIKAWSSSIASTELFKTMRKLTIIQMTNVRFTVTENMSGKKNHFEEKTQTFSSLGISGNG